MSARSAVKEKKSKRDSTHPESGGLRPKLMASALSLLKKQGVQALSMRVIAEGAGCSTMATYRHFESKEHLLSAIACEGFSELRAEIDDVVKLYPDNPMKQLEEVGNRYIRLSLKKPEHLLTMFGSVIEDFHEYKDLEERSENAFFGLVEIVKRCQVSGLLPEGDPIRKAVACWSIVHGFSMLLVNGNLNWLGINLKNSDEYGSYVARAVIEGLRTR